MFVCCFYLNPAMEIIFMIILGCIIILSSHKMSYIFHLFVSARCSSDLGYAWLNFISAYILLFSLCDIFLTFFYFDEYILLYTSNRFCGTYLQNFWNTKKCTFNVNNYILFFLFKFKFFRFVSYIHNMFIVNNLRFFVHFLLLC